jgi:hypothetical protein
MSVKVITGHDAVKSRCPLYPRKLTFAHAIGISALGQKQTHAPQRDRYSIISSAVESSDGGIVTPSAFAVLRLMTNSNLVGCCTGRSEGFSPLRIRPT